MSTPKWVAVGVGVAVLLLGGYAIGAGLAGNGTTPAGSDATTATSQPDTGGTQERDAGSVPDSPPSTIEGCDIPTGEPFLDGDSTAMQVIGEQEGISVEAAAYPRPGYEGNPWTQWGQGLVLGDGRYLSAIGDHIGADGNSYLYEYDPSTGALTMIGDVLSYVDHEPGSWGYGKVHGQIVAGACGEAYFATYWGTRDGLVYDSSYAGDVLFRVDPAGRTITNLGAPIPEHGVPSLAGAPSLGLVYGEALRPDAEDDVDGGPLFVYDTRAQSVIFTGPDGPHQGYRNILVDANGRAYYSTGNGGLAVYDPETNDVTSFDGQLPGAWLRAATEPTEDGRVFGVTDADEVFFVLHPDGEIETLGPARAYTTSMVAHPDGGSFYYVPDAHGGAWESGAPLIEVDGETGEETVLVELNPMAESNLGLRLGGTYSLGIDASGSRLYIGMNAGDLGEEEAGFGEVVLLIVHLP